jgi:hypothetical protein
MQPTSTPSRSRTVDYVGWSLLAAALIFAIYVRVRLREFPLERDEGEFAYAGQLILHGVPPYKLAYNMKLPGTYLAYAALMAVFGQTTPGVHLGLLAVNIATILLLYRFVRELFDPFSAGAAAIAYAILSASQMVLGTAAHATHFVAFFGLAGTYCLWRYLQSSRWWQALASGLLMGLAFLMKQQGVFLMVFGGAAMAVAAVMSVKRSRSERSLPLFQHILNLAIYCAGAVLPYALTCLWLWHAGVFDTFWFWTVTYARQYVAEVPISVAIAMLNQTVLGILAPNWPLGLLALVGIAGVAILGRGRPGLRSFLFAFLLFSFFCTCPGFYFRQHYFIVMLPAVAILIGAGSGLLWNLASGRLWSAPASVALEPNAPAPAARRKRSDAKRAKAEPQPSPLTGFGPRSAAVVLLLLAAVGATVGMQSAFFFIWPPLEACRKTYGVNPFLECPEIAHYLQANSDPEDTIAVFGSEPEIFFDAQRNSATGYIYTYGMMEQQPFARKMQEEMIEEIKKKEPKFVVFVNVVTSWLPQNNERLILDWMNTYLLANYRPVALADIVADNHTDYRWGKDAENYKPRSNVYVFAYRRR